MSPKSVMPARVEGLIHLLRGQRVMLDADLARLHGVETKELNKAVKRNARRFPADCAFQLDSKEVTDLRLQFGTSSAKHGGRLYRPWAFTEEGVAMLSSVLLRGTTNISKPCSMRFAS